VGSKISKEDFSTTKEKEKGLGDRGVQNRLTKLVESHKHKKKPHKFAPKRKRGPALGGENPILQGGTIRWGVPGETGGSEV